MKRFKLSKEQSVELAPGFGGCIATDRILVDGARVGFMRREHPVNPMDSGWQFMAGDESEEYMANNAHHGIYDVNTLANYDRDIIRFLDSEIGTEVERGQDGVLRPVKAH